MCEAHGLRVNRHAFMESEISFHANAQVASTIPNLTLGNQVMHQLLAERLTLGPAPALDGGRFALGRRAGPRLRARPRRGRPRARALAARRRLQHDRAAEVKGAETIVVGGGILGATTLWELAREDMEPLLLEAGRFGEARPASRRRSCAATTRTRRSCGWPCHSRDRLRQLPLHLDCDPVYTRTGWLFLVDAESAVAAAENSLMQDEEGVDIVEVDDLHEFLPGAEGAGIAYALYEPDSGFADPVATTRAYVEAAPARRRARASRARRSRRSRSRAARVRGVRVGGRAGRVRQRRARRRPVVGWRSRAGSGSSCRSRSRASRTSSSRRRRPRRPVRGLVAGRPRLHAPGARVRRRAHARRPRLPQGLRERSTRTPTTTTVDAAFEDGRARPRRLPAAAPRGHAPPSAGASASTT